MATLEDLYAAVAPYRPKPGQALGYQEGPRNNETIFGAWSGYNFQAWCHSYVSYILDQIGLGIGKIAYCPTGVNYWRSRNSLYSQPQAGDVFYLWNTSLGRYSHTGFVRSVDGDWIITDEGNSNAAGSRTGGACVSLRRKWRGTKTVFGRPAYSAVAAPAAQPVVGVGSGKRVDLVVDKNAGYRILIDDGGVFCYGSPFYGSAANVVSAPAVGFALTDSGNGYYILTADGGVFCYGDAAFFGAPASVGRLNAPCKSIDVTKAGYVVLAEDGGIFTYGDAVFRGSAA